MNENRAELKVETIEAAPGAAVRKLQPAERPFSPYSNFTFPVVYVLEDGRRIETSSDHRLKRDAVAELATLPKAPKWETTVELDENGRLYMTTTKIGLSSLMAGD